MKDLLEVEIPPPPEEITQVDRRSKVPDYTVPIMFEITKRDIELAAKYEDCQNCLVATALKRIGHDVIGIRCDGVAFQTSNGWKVYDSSQIGARQLKSLLPWREYKRSLVGKQIILYPV